MNPPVTVEGYVRAPGREIAGLIRAHQDEPDAAAPDAPTGRDMRPAPDVPGITRAAPAVDQDPAESAKPAPLFSNEGIVRQSETRHRGAITAPIAAIFGAMLDAGSALGNGLAGAKTAIARAPIGKTRVTGGPALTRNSGSPDFDRHGNKRSGGGRRRVAGGILVVGIMGVAVLAIAMTSVLPPAPSNSILAGSPGATTNGQVANATRLPDGSTAEPSIEPTAVPTMEPTSVLVGDVSLAPGATRRPTAKPATPKPTLRPTVAPTPTPTPTPAPTPIPGAPAIDAQEVSPLQVPTNATFWVFYIPGSGCSLTRTYVSGSLPGPTPAPVTTKYLKDLTYSFPIGTDGKSGPIPWGPKSNQPGTYSVTATCTAPGGTAKTSPGMTFEWAPAASPPTKAPAATPASSAVPAVR